MGTSALITGASRGIGLGIATRLAEQGYGLTISARDPERLEAVAHNLRAAGAKEVVVAAGDMADPAAVEQLVDAHADRFDTLNALVLNAGFGSSGTIDAYPMRRFDTTIDVNLRGPLTLLQRTLPLLRSAAAADPTRGSKVVALASITGVYAEAGLAVYGATKAALISLIETLNAEESAHGVTATAIAPAFVDTDMATWIHDQIPPETMIQVDDIVELVDALLRLSSRAVVPNIVVGRAGTSSYHA